MAVRSREIPPAEEPAQVGPQRRPRRVGWLSGAAAESGLVWLLRLSGGALVGISVVGSFYGLQGKPAAGPLDVLPQMATSWPILLGAAFAQLVLSVGQWGARQRAQGERYVNDKGKKKRRGGDPRFWLVYLVLLGGSAGLNWIAYGNHLIAWGVPWALAALAVVGGDAAAELVIVAED